MTDRAAALRALADAVEGDDWGELTPSSFASVGDGWIARHAFLARLSQDTCATLQAEVLPGYGCRLDTHGEKPCADVWHPDAAYTSFSGTAPTLPRAWLAAILRALAAKEGVTGC